MRASSPGRGRPAGPVCPAGPFQLEDDAAEGVLFRRPASRTLSSGPSRYDTGSDCGRAAARFSRARIAGRRDLLHPQVLQVLLRRLSPTPTPPPRDWLRSFTSRNARTPDIPDAPPASADRTHLSTTAEFSRRRQHPQARSSDGSVEQPTLRWAGTRARPLQAASRIAPYVPLARATLSHYHKCSTWLRDSTDAVLFAHVLR